MKKKLLTALTAFGVALSLSIGSYASAATVQAPPICNGKPPTNTPCVPNPW